MELNLSGFLPKKMKAADRYAKVSREQWENYKSFGFPIENQLISMIGNKEILGKNLTAATGLAQKVGDVSASEVNRGLRGYGLVPTQAQSITNRRLNNLTTTANMASARDYVRGSTLDLNRQILIGGAPNDGLQEV